MKPSTQRRIEHWLRAGRQRLAEGRYEDADAFLDRILAVTPHSAALHLKGVAALQRGRCVEAVELLEAAISADRTKADYHCDLGTAYHAMRDLVSSEAAYRRGLAIEAHHPASAYNLANLLRERKHPHEALQLYTPLLMQQPDHELAWNNCGLALLDLGRVDEARRCFGQALQLNPRNLEALVNLGAMHSRSGEITQAIELYQLGLALDPSNCDLHLNLSNALLAAGRIDEATANARQAVAGKPDSSAAHSALIFSLDYALDASTRAQQAARRDWYERCIAPLGIAPFDHYRNPEPERRLRVGYVSGDFRSTSAAFAFSAVLFHHDRARFEIYCYSNSIVEDRMTWQFYAHADAWRDISGLTDAEAATVVAKDAIDILVDLSAHMSGNRLGLFAHKPAPIQISAWGYAGGTGMPQMDYLFADPLFLPPQERGLFREEVVDLPAVISYRPPEPPPECSEPPLLRRGYPTFGCFNRLCKISEFSISLWARLLQRIPTSRLLIKSSQPVEDAVLTAFRAKFAHAGVDPARIAFLPHAQWRVHMQTYAEVDILLDPYPHGGGVSLIEGLIMGVPTLTLRGTTVGSRLAASLLHPVGLDAWIADTPDALLDLAQTTCADGAGLAALRAQLRRRTLSSPLGDNAGYARVVEDRYRELWRRRCPELAAARAAVLRQAREAVAAADPASALRRIEPLVQADPKDAGALHVAGMASVQLADWPSAIELLERAAALAPGDPDPLVDLGTALTSADRPGDAIKALERALTLQPGHGTAHYNLGNVLLLLDRLDEAGEHYERARALLPKEAKVVNNQGIVLERRGRPEQAERCFREAVRLAPDFAAARENLGRMLVERGELSEGIEQYERALALAPTTHHLRYELAAWYDKLGLHQRMEWLSAPPASPATLSVVGNLGKQDMQRLFSAITAMVVAELTRQQVPTSRIEHELLRSCGRLMEIDHPGKIWLAQEALRLNPDNLHARIQVGLCHYHDCGFGEAHRVWAGQIARRDALAHRHGVHELPSRVLDTSWYLAVGHIALLDSYVKAMRLGWHPQRRLWLLRAPTQKVPNQAYLDYWRAHLCIPDPGPTGSNWEAIERETGVPRTSLAYVTDHFWANKDAEDRVLWHQQFAAAVQREWEAQRRPPLLSLTEEDEHFGAQVLKQLGLPADAWFACFHVREPGFWWKWNRFHRATRDADILTYVEAMQAVVEHGGWVVRMGDATMKKLPPMPGVVDYAHSALKSQRMDVFLAARCRFFVGVNSGLSLLPPTFGRPCVLTNFVPISVPLPYAADILVPKLLRRRAEDRFLTFDEMFASGLAHVQFVKCMPEDVEVVDNRPEELREAVLEMLDELESGSSAAELPQVHELRSCYDSMVLRHGGFLGSRLSGRFLLRHRHLL